MAIFVPDNGSDYGYDLAAEDEDLLFDIADNQLPEQLRYTAGGEVTSSPLTRDLPSLASDTVPTVRYALAFAPVGAEQTRGGLVLPPPIPLPDAAPLLEPDSAKPRTLPAPTSLGDVVIYPDLSRPLADLEPAVVEQPAVEESDVESNPSYDDAPPLVRFRSFPKKPFSVTDLTSGAWCERQYYYTLTRLPFGRKTRTAIMKQGSKIHKELEDQVHTTVRVEVASKEDGFGLRLWNIVQGLRTLRETGITRELEVWGVVDGNIVNGIIDQLSHSCPNPEMEELSTQGVGLASPASNDQKTITEFYQSNNSGPIKTSGPKIYMTDVKTRGSLKVPSSNAFIRPTKVQLFLYHRFLSHMASDKLDFTRLFRRYGVDPDEPFSDSFLAQMGSLHDEMFCDSNMEQSENSPQATEQQSGSNNHTTATEDLESTTSSYSRNGILFQTLRDLVTLLSSEIRETFPQAEMSLAPLLSVEYRYREDGHVIASKSFPMDEEALDLHLAKDMEWWKGERRSHGVSIDEAFKCRSCEFAETCSWREDLDRKRLSEARAKLQSPKDTAREG